MGLLAEIFDPRALARAMEGGARIRRGLLILLLAAAVYTASTTYFAVEKLRVGYATEGVQLPRPSITEPGEAVFVSILYLSLGFLVVWGVFSIAVYLGGSVGSGLTRLTSAVMHSFIAISVASALLLPLLAASPPQEVVITSAEIRDVKLEYVELVGNLASNGSRISLSIIVLRSPLMVYNASNQLQPIELRSVTARVSDRIESLGDIYIEKISWERIEFSGYEYRTQQDMGRNIYGSFATIASWLWVNSYVTVVVSRVYGVGRRLCATAAIFCLSIMLLLGLL
jgi:hypothetical protein